MKRICATVLVLALVLQLLPITTNASDISKTSISGTSVSETSVSETQDSITENTAEMSGETADDIQEEIGGNDDTDVSEDISPDDETAGNEENQGNGDAQINKDAQEKEVAPEDALKNETVQENTETGEKKETLKEEQSSSETKTLNADEEGEKGEAGEEEEVAEEPTVYLASQDNVNGTFRIEVSGLAEASGIQKVQIQVWSKTDGQDDLKEYTAKKNSQGIYYVNVKISDHKLSTGTYYAQAYMTDKKGTRSLIGETTVKVKRSAGSLNAKAVDAKESKFRITLKDLQGQGSGTVLFAVWSEKDGKDDLKWYTAKESAGSWKYTVKVSSLGETGDYNVQAYFKDSNGTKHSLLKTTFTVTKPTATQIKIINQDNTKGTFQVLVKGLSAPSGIQKVQIPVWSKVNGYDDIKWYDAKLSKNGNYYITVKVAKHKLSLGTYYAHVYVTDGNGIRSCIGGTTASVKITAGSLTAKSSDGKENSFRITLKDMQGQGSGTVLFAVWSEKDGQDDLKWYTAKESSGTWKYTLKVSSLKEAGDYKVRAYFKDSKGVKHSVKSTTFTVTKATADVKVSKASGTTGTFVVTVSNINAPSGVTKVEVPVWCSKNQGDIKWYTAEKSSDGTYKVKVDVANHYCHFGTYKIHVYVTMGNGLRTFAGNTTQKLVAKNYIRKTDLGSGKYKVTIYGPNGGDVSSVKFSAWSKTNGKDDIVWYKGTENSDGSWSATINAKKHKNAGTFYTNAYGVVSGKQKLLGSISYTVPQSAIMSASEQRISKDCNAVYNQVGKNLYNCYMWCVNNISYSSLSSSVPSGYTTTQWFAVYGLENHYGDCRTYAATFYQLAKGLGYDAHYVYGYVPSTSGGMIDHAWVEIKMSGTTYVFDTDFQYETGSNGYKFTYGTSGTWRYSNYYYVD